MLDTFLCFELQTAGVILGWLATVKSLLYLIVTSFTYSYIPGYINGTINDLNNITNATVPDAGYINTSATIVQGLAVAFIALTAVDFIASVLLLYGTVQSKRLLLLPWLVENGFQLLYSILSTIIIVFAVASNTEDIGWSGGVFMFLACFVPIAFSLYCWSAVYSLYHWLAEVDSQRARLLGANGNKAIFGGYQTYDRV